MKNLLVINSILLMAVTITWLYPFYCIARWGTHLVQEPNLIILYVEIAFFSTIFLFGLIGFLRVCREEYRKGGDASLKTQLNKNS